MIASCACGGSTKTGAATPRWSPHPCVRGLPFGNSSCSLCLRHNQLNMADSLLGQPASWGGAAGGGQTRRPRPGAASSYARLVPALWTLLLLMLQCWPAAAGFGATSPPPPGCTTDMNCTTGELTTYAAVATSNPPPVVPSASNFSALLGPPDWNGRCQTGTLDKGSIQAVLWSGSSGTNTAVQPFLLNVTAYFARPLYATSVGVRIAGTANGSVVTSPTLYFTFGATAKVGVVQRARCACCSDAILRPCRMWCSFDSSRLHPLWHVAKEPAPYLKPHSK